LAFGLIPPVAHPRIRINNATVDADGVALAAIQGLNQKLEEKEARVTALEKTVAELQKVVARLMVEKR